MTKGHPISALGDVSKAMREALDAGKRDMDVVNHVNQRLAEQAAKGGKK